MACHFKITYFLLCCHPEWAYIHRDGCDGELSQPDYRVAHNHELCGQLQELLQTSETFGDIASLHEGKPRVCPKTRVHPCHEGAAMIECEFRSCGKCTNPEENPWELPALVTPSLERSSRWWNLESSSREERHKAWYNPANVTVRTAWYESFTVFKEEEQLLNIPERNQAVLYDPLLRNGFLTDIHIDPAQDGLECSICLETTDDQFVALPCAHVFHCECINPWLNGSRGIRGELVRDGPVPKNSCPLCRREWNLCRVRDWGFDTRARRGHNRYE